jgi:hypothetical protein
VLDYGFDKGVPGMLTLDAELPARSVTAARGLGAPYLQALKTPSKSHSPINTAIEKQSWYVVIYQQITISTGKTKLVYY